MVVQMIVLRSLKSIPVNVERYACGRLRGFCKSLPGQHIRSAAAVYIVAQLNRSSSGYVLTGIIHPGTRGRTPICAGA